MPAGLAAASMIGGGILMFVLATWPMWSAIGERLREARVAGQARRSLSAARVATLLAHNDAGSAVAAPGGGLRECPWCAETIKVRAVICRFCGRDVSVNEEPVETVTTSSRSDVVLNPTEELVALAETAEPLETSTVHQRLLVAFPDVGQLVWDASLGIAEKRWGGRRYQVLAAACDLVEQGRKPRKAIEEAFATITR